MQATRSCAPRRLAILALLVVTVGAAALFYWAPWTERGADRAYDTSIARPALAARQPRILFDHAHNNTHSISGRYAPFAKLLRADGCSVTETSVAITAAGLSACDILVIANACGPGDNRESSALTTAEIDIVTQWVTSGGSLLLVADHHPYGPAAAALASAFTVEMIGGWYDDETNLFPGTADTGAIAFTRGKGALGEHAILSGRAEGEVVGNIVTFTGQSLVAPEVATPLLLCAPTGIDRVPVSSVSQTTGGRTTTTFETRDSPATDHCQALAMPFGSGRIVVLGEAAMITAQIDAESGLKFGMNVPGADNRQFLLNTIRWLARELN